MNENPYREEIRAWDWEGLQADADLNDGSVFLGNQLTITPSGKYYTPFFAGNVTDAEIEADEQWFAALEEIAADYGFTIETGEGDPTDLYAIRSAE